MTTVTGSFEGGTDATTISAANSGGASGNAFDSVEITAGNTLVFDNDHAAHGTLAAKCVTTGTLGAGSNAAAKWSTAIGNQNDFWWRMYLWIDTFGAAAVRVVHFDNFGSNGGGINLTSARKIQLGDAVGGTSSVSTNTIPTGQWVRLEGQYDGGNPTTSSCRIYLSPDSASIDETVTLSGNWPTISGTSFGPRNAGFTMWIDDVGIDTVAFMGPAVTVTTSLPPLRRRNLGLAMRGSR
jgi:hypothetical protein